MKWIVKIIESHPWQVTCLWNDGITRTIDLEDFLKKKNKGKGNSYQQLLNEKRFLEVQCDGSTLYWENGITMKDVDGKFNPAPLDIDPDVLFEMTVKTNPVRQRRKKKSFNLILCNRNFMPSES